MTITADTIRAAQNRLRFRRTLIEACCKLGGGPQTWEQASTMTMQEAMQKLGANGLVFFASTPPGPNSPPASDHCSPEGMVAVFEELLRMDAEKNPPRCPPYAGPAS